MKGAGCISVIFVAFFSMLLLFAAPSFGEYKYVAYIIIILLVFALLTYNMLAQNKKEKEDAIKKEKQAKIDEENRLIEEERVKQEDIELKNLVDKLNKENKEKLTPIESDIRIPEKEELYLKIKNVEWFEMRTTTTRTQEYESEDRGEGLFSGNITTFYQTEKDYKEIIQGNLYLTNKSLIVVSNDEAKTLKLNTIADATLYKNAIKMKRLKGKTVLLEIKKVDDAYTLAFFLDRLLKLTSIDLYEEEK